MTQSHATSFRNVHGVPLRELWQMLPQLVPYAVYIDPTNLCNFRCPFCPTGNSQLLKRARRPKGIMDFSLFRRIIQDLAEMVDNTGQTLTRLHLYKDGEPLLNRRLPAMIALAKKAGISGSVETTTNGALLTPKVVSDILDSGLDVIRVSVEHTEDDVYASFSRGKTSYAQIRNNVKLLFSEKNRRGSPLHVFVKIIDCNLTEAQKTKFKKDFSSICDSWNIDRIMGWSSSDLHDFTLGSASSTGMDGITRKKQRRVCPEPFSKLAVNFDGSVSVCCVDWAHGTLVGDLTRQSIQDVWRGERLQQFRLRHLKGERSTLPGCSSCDYIAGFPDFADLDDHVDDLLPLFEDWASESTVRPEPEKVCPGAKTGCAATA